jgi:hypothetical protein
MAADVQPKHGGKRPGAGRSLTHGLIAYRRSLARLGTTKLDQRTTVAIGVKRFMAEVVCPRFRGRLMICALSAAGGSSRS